MSLMAIVEGVTRQNRVAWDRANAGLPADSAIGTGTVNGLVSVRAPPPVTKYNVRGEGGRGIAFESVFAPGSVLAAPPQTSRSANPEPQRRPTSLPPPPRPLRSALRNHTPPPTPPKPIMIPSAPPRVVVEPPPPARTQSRKDPDDDEGSDSGSAASFRTVRETLDEEPVSAPASPALAVPGKDESDASTSTVSAAGAGPAGGAVRRKSVRVSLQPTFSPTPPAIDEDEDEAWERSGRPWGDDGDAPAAEGNGRERDFWADSSDEDEEYSKARRLLTRASKKRW